MRPALKLTGCLVGVGLGLLVRGLDALAGQVWTRLK